MATINAPSTEANVPIHQVAYQPESTSGGFLGGLVQGVIKEAPDVMAARKKRMELLAEGTEDATYQAATMDAEKVVRDIGERIANGTLTAKQGKVEASFALQKVSRDSRLTMKAASSLRDTFTSIISVYGEEDKLDPKEPGVFVPAYGGPARVIGASSYSQEVTAQVQIQSFPTQVQGYFYQLIARDPEAAKDEIGRYSQHLKRLQDSKEAADLADNKLKLNNASKVDQELTAEQNLFQSQGSVVDLFYSIMATGNREASKGTNPQLVLSEANMKIDNMILQNPDLLRLAEAAGVPIAQYVDNVLGNWKERLTSAITGVDPLLAKTRNVQELEADMRQQDVYEMLKIKPEARHRLNNSTKFLDAAILKKMESGSLGAAMPKSLETTKLEVRQRISHGNEVNRRASAYKTPSPQGLHSLVTESAGDFQNIGKALAGDLTAIEEVRLMDIDATKRQLEVITSDPNFKALGPKTQADLLKLKDTINDVYKRM
jgi:hypothetical protein